MKLFQQKSVIEKYDDVKSFVEAYNIGADDFILATKRIYETCFAPLNLKAHVEYKSKYGSGEPTDVMIDALLEDFRQGDYKRIIAIGGGAVIDMAKILVLDGKKYRFAKCAHFLQCRQPVAQDRKCPMSPLQRLLRSTAN